MVDNSPHFQVTITSHIGVLILDAVFNDEAEREGVVMGVRAMMAKGDEANINEVIKQAIDILQSAEDGRKFRIDVIGKEEEEDNEKGS